MGTDRRRGSGPDTPGPAADGDAEDFARLVGEAAEVVDSGTATIDAHGVGADPMVVRAAFAVRVNGGVGLAPDPENDRWWLVRVEAISFEPEPWDTTDAERVKPALVTCWRRNTWNDWPRPCGSAGRSGSTSPTSPT